MKTRLELHNKLVELFGSDRVYYQPPENLKMEYPAIVYTINDMYNAFSDDIKYYNRKQYKITIIDKKPDNIVISKILDLPLSSYDRHYATNNLNHDVITLYY